MLASLVAVLYDFSSWFSCFFVITVRYNSIVRPDNKLNTRGGTRAALVHFAVNKPFELNSTVDAAHAYAECV